MVDPYFGQDFFSFFHVFFQRLFTFFSGEFYIDEMQILCLSMLSISSALIGSFLVLRKMTMLANALSHTVLPAIVVAFLFFQTGFYEGNILGPLFFASIISALITTFLTQFLMQKFRLATDSSIGLVFTTLFALGIVMVTIFTKDVHIGLESVMGNIDMLHKNDVLFSLVVLGLNLVLTIAFYKEYQVTSFDPIFSQASGIKTNVFHYLLMLQVAFTCVMAFRSVGVILVLSFLTIPPMTARLLTNELKKMLLLSSVTGIGISIFAVALSRHLLTLYHFAASTSGLVVTLQGIFFFFVALLRQSKSGLAKRFAK